MGRDAQGKGGRQEGSRASVPLSGHMMVSAPPCLHQPGSCVNPILWRLLWKLPLIGMIYY